MTDGTPIDATPFNAALRAALATLPKNEGDAVWRAFTADPARFIALRDAALYPSPSFDTLVRLARAEGAPC